MNRQQKKEKIKHQKEVQKLIKKYIGKDLFTICNSCKYRLDNCTTKQLNDDSIHYCSNGRVDLNIIREQLKRRK